MRRGLERGPIPFRVPDGATLCLFGFGVLARSCYPQIVQMLGRRPDVICDNDPSKWNTTIAGVPCLSFDELKALPGEVVVVITSRDRETILAQLRGFGTATVVDYERSYDRVRSVRPAKLRPREIVGLLSVQDRWVLVTGAARGLGRLIATEMARRGANLVLHARELSHLEEVADQCHRLGRRTRCLAADFAKVSGLESFVDALSCSESPIEIVFNNAGISPPCPGEFWETPSQDYLEAFAVNALAPARICQNVLPTMLERRFGRIVNITSSIRDRIREMAYSCSKAALDKFVHDLAPTLDGTGVMISLADPGWLRTDMGGPEAIHPVGSALPGVLLGALLDGDVNGTWITAQDYAGLDLEQASVKAALDLHLVDGEVA